MPIQASEGMRVGQPWQPSNTVRANAVRLMDRLRKRDSDEEKALSKGTELAAAEEDIVKGGR